MSNDSKLAKIAQGVRRRSKRPFTDAIVEGLDEAMPEDVCKALKLPRGTVWARGIQIAALRTAVMGVKGVQQRKDLRESIEGKATQRIEMLSAEDRKIEFVVRYEELPRKVEKVLDAVKVEEEVNGEE